MSVNISKENIDEIFRELSKEYRKHGGKFQNAEVVVVGGGAVILGFEFRRESQDIDAIILASQSLKDAAVKVADMLDLDKDWLNSDFMNTSSYSPKLRQYSKYYRTYSNVLQVRTIEPVYIVAMKLKSGRSYKTDQSDIIGIVQEMDQRKDPITIEKLDEAMNNLYGGYDGVDEYVKELAFAVIKDPSSFSYAEMREKEISNRNRLIDFEKRYTGVLNIDNVEAVIQGLDIHEKRIEKEQEKEHIHTVEEDYEF